MALSPKPARKRARDADAVRVVRERTREPRLPHDRDESADSQVKGAPGTQSIGRRAYDDVKAGRVDTDRGPVLEELGRRLPSNETPVPAPARGRRRR
ncbi:MAG: hypothetical protein KIT60_17945 [Burkholderiaceae bacterium]|nr:hypothetical protein [Burkholderiaceae bacterium]